MPSQLDQAFTLRNLQLAWKRLLTNPEALYKRYFRQAYSVYATAAVPHLGHLHDRLSRGIYEPTAPCKLYLLKGSGGLRPISLLPLEDQIVYQALTNVVAESLRPRMRKSYYRAVFSNVIRSSGSIYLFEPWKDGYRRFSHAILQAYDDGLRVAASFDLTACYDAIDHQVLRHFLLDLKLEPEFCDFLMNTCLRCWTKDVDGGGIYHGHGIPQGPQASSVLAEAVLRHFDTKVSGSKIRYLRYVDDIRLYAADEQALRRHLVHLDLASKQIGLFPQSAKIAIHHTKRRGDGIKSISIPPEPPAVKAPANQAALRRRICQLTPAFTVSDETRFKYLLAQLKPSKPVARRLLRVLAKQLHLYPSILAYFELWSELPQEVTDHLLLLLKTRDAYPDFLASTVRCTLGRVAAASIPAYLSVLRVLERRRKTNKIGHADLWLSCHQWLIQNHIHGYPQLEELLSECDSWWCKRELIGTIDWSYWGKPNSASLLNRLARDRSADVALTAAFAVAINELQVSTPRKEVHPLAEVLLKELGLIKRSGNPVCGVQRALRVMMGSDPMHGKSWKATLSKHYKAAERLLTEAAGYYSTDPTAWANVMDSFGDLLLDAVCKHDPSAGGYTLGKPGAILSNRPGKFARGYPRLFKGLQALHEARYGSMLSHAYRKADGRMTGRITHNQAAGVIRLLHQGLTELRAKW